jgi:large exoprotein involved in heme utilization and adhesion
VDANGDSGSITVIATDSLTLTGTNGSKDKARNRGSRITVGSRSTATGDSGSININAPDVLLADGARISSSTSGVGEGGSIGIIATEKITLKGERLDGSGSSIRASTEVEAEEASDIDLPRNGNAGAILIQTSQLNLEEGSEIVSNTSLPGSGGLIDLQVNGLEMSGATIQTTSNGQGSGDAGNISVSAQSKLMLKDSVISTSATHADGGNIELNANHMIRFIASEVTTSVESGIGGGGNIAIDPDFVILDRSRIIANAFGGPGGNISIIAGQFIASPDSRVAASSVQSIDGNVQIVAPDTDISGDISQLSEAFIDVSALIKARCGAGRNFSSFIVTGSRGLTAAPEGFLPSSNSMVTQRMDISDRSIAVNEIHRSGNYAYNTYVPVFLMNGCSGSGSEAH